MYIYNVEIKEGSTNRISRTSYFYSATSESIKIFKEDAKDGLKFKFEFKGNFINKKCCFRIDQKERFKFRGVIKPPYPADPIRREFWEYGFTRARRKKSIEEVKGDIMMFDYEDTDTGIKNIFKCNNKKEWWAHNDITLDKAKELMDKYKIISLKMVNKQLGRV